MLTLHAGASPVDYDGLRALETPPATATHVPIPHFRVVDLIAHALAYYGHTVTEQHFGLTPDGMRFFGVLSLKSDYTGYSDMVGLRKIPNLIAQTESPRVSSIVHPGNAGGYVPRDSSQWVKISSCKEVAMSRCSPATQ